MNAETTEQVLILLNEAREAYHETRGAQTVDEREHALILGDRLLFAARALIAGPSSRIDARAENAAVLSADEEE